jgi:hypothetical protein
MKKIEYTWNELENENIRFQIDGIALRSAGGPDEISGGAFWSPAFDESKRPYDLMWVRSGSFGDADFFTLTTYAIAII